MRIYRAILTIHDFLFYISREYGRKAVTEPVINNFALNYAINTMNPKLHAFVSSNKPRYESDMGQIKLYATPAQPYKWPVANIAFETINWEWNNPVWISYNAIDSTVYLSMEQKRKLVLPMFGSYQRFPPLNSFEFFVIGGKGPSLIRIGKKLIPARIRYYDCFDIKLREGIFVSSHPANYIEIKDNYELLSGKILMIPPTPIVLNPKLRGRYIYCKFNDEQGNIKHATIIPPNKDIYKEVTLNDAN